MKNDKIHRYKQILYIIAFLFLFAFLSSLSKSPTQRDDLLSVVENSNVVIEDIVNTNILANLEKLKKEDTQFVEAFQICNKINELSFDFTELASSVPEKCNEATFNDINYQYISTYEAMLGVFPDSLQEIYNTQKIFLSFTDFKKASDAVKILLNSICCLKYKLFQEFLKRYDVSILQKRNWAFTKIKLGIDNIQRSTDSIQLLLEYSDIQPPYSIEWKSLVAQHPVTKDTLKGKLNSQIFPALYNLDFGRDKIEISGNTILTGDSGFYTIIPFRTISEP